MWFNVGTATFYAVTFIDLYVVHTSRGPTPEIVAGLARHARGVLNATYTIAESGTAGPNTNPYGSDVARNRTA